MFPIFKRTVSLALLLAGMAAAANAAELRPAVSVTGQVQVEVAHKQVATQKVSFDFEVL